jgi:hypothetical protein
VFDLELPPGAAAAGQIALQAQEAAPGAGLQQEEGGMPGAGAQWGDGAAHGLGGVPGSSAGSAQPPSAPWERQQQQEQRAALTVGELLPDMGEADEQLLMSALTGIATAATAGSQALLLDAEPCYVRRSQAPARRHANEGFWGQEGGEVLAAGGGGGMVNGVGGGRKGGGHAAGGSAGSGDTVAARRQAVAISNMTVRQMLQLLVMAIEGGQAGDARVGDAIGDV